MTSTGWVIVSPSAGEVMATVGGFWSESSMMTSVLVSEPTLPTASTARTENVWAPSARPLKLTELTEKQASYLGIPVAGPYKPEFYRY